LGKWADSKGKGDEFNAAVFRAYYVEGINIAQADELVCLAAAAGFSSAEAGEVLLTRAFREAVDADWKLAERLGISAVPTLVLDNRTVVGAQPYNILEKFLLDHGVKRR